MNECAPAEMMSPRAGVPGRVVTVAVTLGMTAMTALAFWGQTDAHGTTAVLLVDLMAGVAACALVPVMLRRPVTGALALTVLVALSPVVTPTATMGAWYVARWRRFPVAGAVAAAGIAAHAIQALSRPPGGLSYGWWVFMTVVAYAALVGWGALGQARHSLIVSLRERADRAEAEQGRRVAEARVAERAQIAREMHDVLAHRLSLVATYAGALEFRPDASPEKLSQAAGVVRAGVHQALDELRAVISLLRDDGPEGTAGEGRPQPVLTDLPRLVGESLDAGMRVRLDDRTADPATLPATTGRTAYRVVQEGLTNARKHAPGVPIEVTLDGRPGTRLVIDLRNPLPEDPEAVSTIPGSGTGLIGLTERVRLAGGRLDHEITSGEFRLRASLPWPA
ncbi:two-component sensor histidine kinase [Planotetraspora silvatica]|uniref:histidine kinase n=1 Tax=Planotetraspora silvatica TaxID=234614 RepID=A0A8J3UYS1_9ACTN|nr:histidine kinase [Planotetraspora silvatica]GII46905.1 two-component sensor histidine kinase [Planotetraspora silvatica]